MGALDIDQVLKITDGWETEVFSFKIVPKKDFDNEYTDLILRIYPGADAYQKSYKEFTMKESSLIRSNKQLSI